MNEALKMTQRVKHLWPKHKDLGSDPQNQCESKVEWYGSPRVPVMR